MSRIRFTLGTLLGVILVLGVVLAALKESSDLWECGIFSVTLVILLASILCAVHRTESRRSFWIGFALFGWAYLGLSLVPSIESRLMTTKALAFLDSKVPGRSLGTFTAFGSGIGSGALNNQFQSLTFNADGRQLATSSRGQVRLWDASTGKLLGGWAVTTENFIRIGHSLIALLAGWFGGLLSRRLSRASRSPETAAAGHSCP